MTSARIADHTNQEATRHTSRTPRTDRTDGPPITFTERHAVSTTEVPATRADDRSEESSRDAQSLTGDVASALLPPGAAAGINRTPQPVAHRGLRAWAARRPVISFLVLLFALAYPVMSLPVLAAHGVIPDGWMPRLPGVDTERIAATMLVFLALLPTTLLVTWAVDGRPGVLRLMRRMFRWRIGARWWLIVIAGLPTLTMALALLLGDHLTPVDVLPFAVTQTIGFVVNLLLINLWEETAWAGFVQTRLERRHSLPIAAILTAIPFALIHMPLHFIGDFTAESLATALVTLLIVCILVRLLLGVVLRGTRDSILAVALVHTVFNRSNNDEGVVAGLLEGEVHGLAGLLAVILLATTVAIIARRRLNRAYRTHLDTTDMVDR
jgi:membrane protease YdiL (CAAX protease family)